MAYNVRESSNKENHAMKKTYLFFLFGLMLFSSLRAFGAQISTDYDHSTNFSQYKTYSWLKVQAGDSLWQDRIKQDVDAQLSAKGWRGKQSDALSGNPDKNEKKLAKDITGMFKHFPPSH